MINFKFGSLTIFPALERQDLLASKVAEALVSLPNASEIGIAEIDPTLSDTAAFCAHYGVALDSAANCVVLEAARADRSWFAACLVLGTTRADVNRAAAANRRRTRRDDPEPGIGSQRLVGGAK